MKVFCYPSCPCHPFPFFSADGGGGHLLYLILISSSLVEIRLHTKIKLPRGPDYAITFLVSGWVLEGGVQGNLSVTLWFSFVNGPT
jgi:hypothetical protein